MDGKRKKKAYEYIEGHKRETRKSYQHFIEKESSSIIDSRPTTLPFPTTTEEAVKTKEGVQQSEGEMTDRVRKSSRTPVPKKSFDLVDKYEKVKAKEKNYQQNEPSLGGSSNVVTVTSENVVNVKKEHSESDSDQSSRKSQRTPIPKRTFDLIDSSSVRSRHQNVDEANFGGNSSNKSVKNETKIDAKSSKAQKQKAKKGSVKVPKDNSGKTPAEIISLKIKENLANADGKIQDKTAHDDRKTSVKEGKKKKNVKGDRKRQHEEIAIGVDLEDDKPESQEEKLLKTQHENLDESVLMEALQALNQEPKEIVANVANDDKTELAVTEKKGRRSTKKMIAAKSLHKTVRVKQEEEPAEVQIKEEQVDFDEEELQQPEDFTQEDLNCSTSVTERPDGHIILKLGGLNSPTKVKKHKKKHKHHHHHRHHDKITEDNYQSGTLTDEQDVVFSESGSAKKEVKESLESADEITSRNLETSGSKAQKSKEHAHKKEKKRKSNLPVETKDEEEAVSPLKQPDEVTLNNLELSATKAQQTEDHTHKKNKKRKSNLPIENKYEEEVFSPSKASDEVALNSLVTSVTKAQQTKDHTHKKNKKRKRHLSIDAKDRYSEDDAQKTEDLIIKKRKIYKKKKGEKILVRIQTEYWSKNGELVKVEPSEAKEKPTDVVKMKKSKVDSNRTQKTDMKNVVIQVKKLDTSGLVTKNIMNSAKHGKSFATGYKSSKGYEKEKDLEKLIGTPSIAKKKKSKPKPKDGAQSNESSPTKKKKERKTQTLTAYLLFCRKYRPKVVAENPRMGFCEISKELAKMWGDAAEKEKEIYKKQLEEHRAKINATKRKQNTKLKTTKQAGTASPDKEFLGLPSSSKKSSKEYQIAPQKYLVSNLEPIDMAAHLQLLGESLTLVATALRRQGNMKVHGALSVLLDSCLCSMAPLLFLTSSIPQIDVIPADTKANILDNIAYILPGL